MARRELVHAGVERCRRRHHEIREVWAQHLRVDFALYRRMLEQRLDLRAEDECPAALSPVERLLADRVPREQDAVSRGVPEREGEHPGEMLDAVLPVTLVQVED